MRERIFALSIIVCLLLSFVHSAAASLQADYSLLVNKRLSLENQRVRYEEQNKILEKNRRLVEQTYAACTSKKWRITWQKYMERAEEAREELENDNKKLVKFNIDLKKENNELERERSTIEESYIIKNDKYEREIRNWMRKVDTEYFSRLELELFRGYEEYMNGIEKYISFVRGATTRCQGDGTTPIVEITIIIRLIPKITSGMKSLMDFLKKNNQ